VAKVFVLGGGVHLEAIGEIFNLFNSINPSSFSGRQNLGTMSNPSPNADFLRPTEYSGDFQNTEQLVGQLGFRITF
jgi:hypothetical protein